MPRYVSWMQSNRETAQSEDRMDKERRQEEREEMRQQMRSMKCKREKAEREEWEDMGRKEEEKKKYKEEKKESWSGYKRGWIERGEGEIFGRSVSGRTCKHASVQTINKYEWKSGHGSWEAREGWFVHSPTRGWSPVAAHVHAPPEPTDVLKVCNRRWG